VFTREEEHQSEEVLHDVVLAFDLALAEAPGAAVEHRLNLEPLRVRELRHLQQNPLDLLEPGDGPGMLGRGERADGD